MDRERLSKIIENTKQSINVKEILIEELGFEITNILRQTKNLKHEHEEEYITIEFENKDGKKNYFVRIVFKDGKYNDGVLFNGEELFENITTYKNVKVTDFLCTDTIYRTTMKNTIMHFTTYYKDVVLCEAFYIGPKNIFWI